VISATPPSSAAVCPPSVSAAKMGLVGQFSAECGRGQLVDCQQASNPRMFFAVGERRAPKRHDPSPIYLSMMPLLCRTGSDITVMYRFNTLTNAAGVMPSLKAVNPVMSQNKMVISRREPLASVRSGRSISPATIRGSTYLPKVSRICALTLSSPTRS